MKEKKPAHRPTRHFPNATRIICQPESKSCPYCKSRLKSTGSLYIDKQVQTLTGPVNVRAYGYACYNPDCFATAARYHATRELWKISLPNGTYGLDVIAYIGWQHDREHRQFLEIQQQLSRSGIIISSRHVGRLYRQYLSLVASLNEQMIHRLTESAKIHGGLIWSVDALQPDQDGTQLYLLYEVLSKTPVSAAWINKRNHVHLRGWLEPISQLALPILATISDGEPALIKVLKELWSKCPHQMCHTHFLGDCAKPIRQADRKLQQTLAAALSKLPPVPGSELSARAGPKAETLPLEPVPNQITHDSNIALLASSLDQIPPRTAGSGQQADYIAGAGSSIDLPNPDQMPSQNPDLTKPVDQMPSQNPDLPKPADQMPGMNSDLPKPADQMPGMNSDLPKPVDQMPGMNSDLPKPVDQMLGMNSDLPKPADHIGLAATDWQCSPDTRVPKSTKVTDLSDQMDSQTACRVDLATAGSTTVPICPISMAVSHTDQATTDGTISDPSTFSWQGQPNQSVSDWGDLESENIAWHFSDASKMVLLTIWCGANLSVLMSDHADCGEHDQQATAVSSLTINLNLAGKRAPLSLSDHIELRKMEIELSLRKSFQDVLRRASRYPSCFGGLDGYDQLSQIVAGLENSLSDHNGDTYLHQLMRQGQTALDSSQVMIQDLQNARQKLHSLTILLKVPENQEEFDQLSAEKMKKKVDSLLAEIKKEETGEITLAFVAECERLLNKWSESLFNCYDLRLLPANNGLTSSRFNELRRNQRRVSGRKKTSPLRRFAHFQILLSASSIEELCELFAQVSFSTYHQARQSLDAAEERERVRYRLRRWPYKTAQALGTEYETLCQINPDEDDLSLS